MEPQTKYAGLNVVGGVNGTGKSTFINNLIEADPRPNAIVYMEDIDTYGKPFSAYPMLTDFYKYNGGRVRLNANDIPYPVLCDQCAKYFRNGILVIDEAGFYEKLTISDHLTKILKPMRKYNIEIYLMYHGVSEMPIGSFKNVSNVILFHMTEEFESKNRVPRIKELIAMQQRIRKQYFSGNRYYGERLKLK